jgi:hypothetical protein
MNEQNMDEYVALGRLSYRTMSNNQRKLGNIRVVMLVSVSLSPNIISSSGMDHFFVLEKPDVNGIYNFQ